MYHDRTLKLLGITGEADNDRDAAELSSWAVAHGLTIPAAFEEWVRLGGQDTMRRLNPDEAFFFTTPEVVATSRGPGLSFCRETHGNWRLVALLNHGDDPPVVFNDWGHNPEVLHADSFSDCIFSQVFDWQHMFEFYEDGDSDMANSASITLQAPPSPDVLRQRFNQHATTHCPGNVWLGDDKVYDNQRYSRSPDERLIVTVAEGEPATITIYGADDNAILAVEAELLEWLGADVCAEFNTSAWAAQWLAQAIDTMEIGNLARIRHGCREEPSPEALARLVSCHRAEPLPRRLGYGGFEDMGGQEWGVRVNFTMLRPGCWRLDGIVAA